jgi:hypothetical protein
MLLELITGQRAFDLARLANDDDVMLLDWVNYRTTAHAFSLPYYFAVRGLYFNSLFS